MQNTKTILEMVLEVLRYGAIGLAAILAILAFLIQQQSKQASSQPAVVQQTYRYMYLCLAFFIIGIGAELISKYWDYQRDSTVAEFRLLLSSIDAKMDDKQQIEAASQNPDPNVRIVMNNMIRALCDAKRKNLIEPKRMVVCSSLGS